MLQNVQCKEEESRMTPESTIYTNKHITINGKKFRVPRCAFCRKGMTATKDPIAKKTTGYVWKCTCKEWPKDLSVCIG